MIGDDNDAVNFVIKGNDDDNHALVHRSVDKFVFVKDQLIVQVIQQVSQLSTTHALHVWPSAIVMVCYMLQELPRKKACNDYAHIKTICELGCGCAVPGIALAKMGHRVVLTDMPIPDEAAWKLQMIDQCNLNGLNVQSDACQIMSLIWGQFDPNLMQISQMDIDYIIGSDCFYDSKLFEPLLVSVSYILSRQEKKGKRECKFVTTYHERVESYQIKHLLDKWKLKAQILKTSNYISPQLYEQIYSLQSVNAVQKYQDAIDSIRIIVISLANEATQI